MFTIFLEKKNPMVHWHGIRTRVISVNFSQCKYFCPYVYLVMNTYPHWKQLSHFFFMAQLNCAMRALHLQFQASTNGHYYGQSESSLTLALDFEQCFTTASQNCRGLFVRGKSNHSFSTALVFIGIVGELKPITTHFQAVGRVHLEMVASHSQGTWRTIHNSSPQEPLFRLFRQKTHFKWSGSLSGFDLACWWGDHLNQGFVLFLSVCVNSIFTFTDQILFFSSCNQINFLQMLSKTSVG